MPKSAQNRKQERKYSIHIFYLTQNDHELKNNRNILHLQSNEIKYLLQII